MTATTHTHKRERVPHFQNGDKAIVLGAREGNIGGAIAEALCCKGWIAAEDDCYRPLNDRPVRALREDYQAPLPSDLGMYDACVITLGTTHMEPFSEVSESDLHKVLYGSLELPLECARRYVQGRKHYLAKKGGGPHKYPGAPGHNPDDPGDCFTSNCEYGCGCWAGPSRSGGPDSIDPFGPCPNSPNETRSVIVFIGSYAHNHPFTHCTSYCVAKAGLDMACKSLAWELMPEGFDVHIIHPHHVQGTPMTDEVLKGMQKGVHKMTSEQAREYQRKDLRMPSLLTAKEVADMVLLILEAPLMRWVSGRGLEMFGGVR